MQKVLKKKNGARKMNEMQVDYLQGYYYGRPCAREQFIKQYTSGMDIRVVKYQIVKISNSKNIR